MKGTTTAAALLVAATLALAPDAFAGGGRYVFDGGTPNEQLQVHSALEASSFDWSVVPVTVTVHIARGIGSSASPAQIWLDADLLDAGTFAWGVVQHEYAHQVDFFLLSASARAQLLTALGGAAWWQSSAAANAPDGTLQHASLASERFASTIAWSYWQSPANVLRPHGPGDESDAMPPAKFRQLLASMLAKPASAAAS
jgi:hypothetical protein